MVAVNRETSIARSVLIAVFLALLFAGALFLAVSSTLETLVRSTLRAHAEQTTRHLAYALDRAIPDLSGLFKTGAATPAQRAGVASVLELAGISRVRLFDLNGTMVFDAEEPAFATAGDAELRAIVPESRVAIMADGYRSGAPKWYIRARLPMRSESDGHPLGVAQIFVDVTDLADTLHRRFAWLSQLIVIGGTVIFLIPALLIVQRNHVLRRRDAKMRKISRNDALTGTLNRSAFTRESARLFRDRKPGTRMGVFFIDVDKFKEVNDSLGHDFGDALLKHIADLLNLSARDGDLLARIGGDEFVILAPGITGAEIDAFAGRLLTALSSRFGFDGKSVWPSLSIGVHLSLPGEPEAEALRRADLALYKAKANGRGRFVTYSEHLEKLDRRRRHVIAAMQDALAKDRFFLVYQPVFDRARNLKGFEALLRLRDADGNLIGPAEFIPLAEQANLIQNLGRWAIRNAIAAAAGWPGDIFVAVNVSAREFGSGELPAYLDAVLAEHRVPPCRVSLELAEGMIFDGNGTAARQILELKSLGVQVTIDDFGTGVSSLTHLWRYRFDRLKIDRALLAEFRYDAARYRTIVETIVEMAHRLGMSVTAEGLETAEQLADTVELGCDTFQGFHLSPPVDAESAARLASEAARRDSA